MSEQWLKRLPPPPVGHSEPDEKNDQIMLLNPDSEIKGLVLNIRPFVMRFNLRLESLSAAVTAAWAVDSLVVADAVLNKVWSRFLMERDSVEVKPFVLQFMRGLPNKRRKGVLYAER